METSLDHADIPDAYRLWPAMIDAARASIDVAQFYASNREGSRLEPVIAALLRAGRRGVAVRFVASSAFVKTYPKTLERLAAAPGIDVRHLDGKALGGNGVLHAKYFVVDGREAFLGSQNFDWRALAHIQELGVRIRDRDVVAALGRVFELDWELAAGDGLAGDGLAGDGLAGDGLAGDGAAGDGAAGDVAAVDSGLRLVASPRGALPVGVAWDLPALVGLIDGAKRSVRVQLLSLRDDVPELGAALASAGRRGVRVEILVSNWNSGPRRVGPLKALAQLPGVTVKFATIPEWSGGFIPFARVIHAKYMVVDGERFWVGTSNWSRSYFYDSRNVGVVGRGEAIGVGLERFFGSVWSSEYATRVEEGAVYPAPRIE